MVDITHKIFTYRKAIAQATVKVSHAATIDAVVHKTVPKGDVLAMATAAGLLGIKKTADLIPDCHPIPIEESVIRFEILPLEIQIIVEVATVYKTGVEVEAMHGASVVALTIYDMLKPIDKGVEIGGIKLLEKTGGKSNYIPVLTAGFKAAVIVISDSVFAGKKEDKAGKIIVEKLAHFGIHAPFYHCVSDEMQAIENQINTLVAQQYDLVITTGGTGLSPRDNTPNVVSKIIDHPIPGIMEAARNYGQQRTPYAMLSRGVAGFAQQTLIITLPGSGNGAKESMDALFPYLLHVFKVLKVDYRHD
jgi:molybdenum cofactor biosynthesis protein MoaC